MSDSINFTVKTMTGNKIPIKMNLDENLFALSEKINETEGIPTYQQRFLVPGYVSKRKTLRELDVKEGAEIILMLSLKGKKRNY